ncbi:unnamed protein product [Durusdinium trenchii]|uniref:Uncharacterized protein n=1 Tax=Durusdinium trenchii TaxID=1381693 RepID=A0ABP0N3W1_9DINO
MALVPFVVPEAAVHQSPLVQNADRNWACSLRAASMASQVALGASLFIGASRVRRGKKIARGSIGDSSRNIAVAERSNAERLQQMSARELKQLLLELGMESGIFPHSSGGRRRLSRISQVDEPPIVVALKQVTQDADLIPSGAGFTDGERLALPIWSDSHGPMWFLLDTSLKRSAVRASIAEELGSVGRPCSGLRFASEPVGSLDVQIVPDDSVVLGPDRANISGLLGVDFLHYFDLDLDLQRGICRAWPSGPALPRGFGLPDAVEIELFQDKGLLLVDAQLRGTVCSGTDTCGPPLRAVLDLGQTHSACNWVAAMQVGVRGPNDPCTRRAGEWNDVDGRPMDVHEADLGVELPGRVGGVLPGTRLCGGRLFWLAESLPILKRLGFIASDPMAVLGLDTVGRVRFAISAKHKRLWLPM